MHATRHSCADHALVVVHILVVYAFSRQRGLVNAAISVRHGISVRLRPGGSEKQANPNFPARTCLAAALALATVVLS